MYPALKTNKQKKTKQKNNNKDRVGEHSLSVTRRRVPNNYREVTLPSLEVKTPCSLVRNGKRCRRPGQPERQAGHGLLGVVNPWRG